jgi:hypothetical protein
MIMRYVEQQGQIPHIVDIATGAVTPPSLGAGFWMFPAWR